MARTKLGFLSLALLCATASGQTNLDLSKDPRLQQTLDVHLKRVLLPDLLRFLHSHSDQKFIIDKQLEHLMACVFVEKRPLWLVMEDVADVFGCQWKDLGSEWRLGLPKETATKIGVYAADEFNELRRQCFLRGTALADLASKQKWSGSSGDAQGAAAVPIEEESPEKWASRVSRDPAYRVAGLMFSRIPALTEDGAKYDSPVNLLHSSLPVCYRLVAPPTPEIAETNQCGPAGEYAVGLEGTLATIRVAPWAGTIQAVVVDGNSHKIERPRNLLRYPRPTERLSTTAAGKWLLEWETPLDESSDPACETSVSSLTLKPSPFFDQARGIEEYLETLADSTHTPVVSDAFRIPAIGKEVPESRGTVRDWLKKLKESEKCFVRVENGSVLVRHGGFWDLRDWEPSEEIFARLEQTPNPRLDDYADCAFAQLGRTWSDIDILMPFYESQQIPLAKVDLKPLRDSYITLAALGQMNARQRTHIYSGGWIDTYRSYYDTTQVSSQVQYVKDKKGRNIPILVQTAYGSYSGDHMLVMESARQGPFYGGYPVGLALRLMECSFLPGAYRHLWGDSPDDNPDFLSRFDGVKGCLAHYFSLYYRSGSAMAEKSSALSANSGLFSFFSSISDLDGVINTISIPDHKSSSE